MFINIVIATFLAVLMVFGFAWNRKRAGDYLPRLLSKAKELSEKHSDNPKVRDFLIQLSNRGLKRYNAIYLMSRIIFRIWFVKSNKKKSDFSDEQLDDMARFLLDEYMTIQLRLAPVAMRLFGLSILFLIVLVVLMKLVANGFKNLSSVLDSEKRSRRIAKLESAMVDGYLA